VPTVFISSTSEDLKAYRAAARDAAISAGFHPEMMEYFAASAGPPLSECLEKVSACDLVVAIVAHRYGWAPRDQPDGDAKSITWLEGEHAARAGKDVLAFILHKDKDASWPPELKESYRTTEAVENGAATPELLAEVTRNLTKLKEFRRWLDEGRTRATFSSPDDLRANILAALHQWRERHPEHGPAEPPPGDPQRYLEWLREQTATIDIRGLGVGSGKAHNFPIEELYIPLTTAAMSGAGLAERQPLQLQTALTHRRLVIVGDPGAGKTTFLRRIAHELAADAQDPPTGGRSLFPLLIRIAELSEHIRNCENRPGYPGPTTNAGPGWIADFLKSRNAEMNWGLDERFFSRLLQEGSAILLLDGLDEAPDRRDRERMARLFEEATQAYRDCRFVVTTRPQSYEGHSILKDFTEARIEPLEAEAIETFLARWCRGLFPDSAQNAKSHQAELSEALRARAEIRRMARNPVMLTALAVVHWNERRLPEQRADLYDSILTWLARSREKRPGRESAERCLTLLQEVALAMQNHPGGRQVRVSIGAAAETLAPEFSQSPERERFPRALAFLEQEQSDSGIVVSRRGELQFWHLTFQEYLAARAVAGRGDSAQHALLLNDGKIYRPEWREPVLLLAGILGKLGKAKADALVSAILDGLEGNPALAAQARCAGLLGAIVRDLQPFAYQPRDPRYREVMDAALGIFDEDQAETVEFNVRLEAAEALGQAGDPRIGHDNWVRIGAFEIGKYPVTVEEYARFVEDDGYHKQQWWEEGGFGKWSQPNDWDEQKAHPNRPVVGVSWFEAAAYCAWKGVRLPAEVEWERAAGVVSGRRYPWGDEEPDATTANFGLDVTHATPVGLYPRGATPEGIQDLAGNVWEWMRDWHKEGAARVVRGGAWYDDASFLRTTYRVRAVPESGSNSIGFRCARDDSFGGGHMGPTGGEEPAIVVSEAAGQPSPGGAMSEPYSAGVLSPEPTVSPRTSQR
jgi:hypothetical protein